LINGLSGESMTDADKFVIRWARESAEVNVVNTEQQVLFLWNSIIEEITVLYPHDVVVKQYCEYIYKLYGEVFEEKKPPCEELLVRIEQLEDLIWALDLEKQNGS
jgi:hypothetical protein